MLTYPQTSPCQKLKYFAHFREYPAKFEYIKDFQSSLAVFGDKYTVTTSRQDKMDYQ
jgi:hypothetical protein